MLNGRFSRDTTHTNSVCVVKLKFLQRFGPLIFTARPGPHTRILRGPAFVSKHGEKQFSSYRNHSDGFMIYRLVEKEEVIAVYSIQVVMLRSINLNF